MFKDWTEIRHLPDGNERIVREQARQGEYFRRWQAIHQIVGDQHTSRLSREFLARRGFAYEREVALYAIHGTLHLLGYDDHAPDDRRRMRRRERTLLDPVFGPARGSRA